MYFAAGLFFATAIGKKIAFEKLLISYKYC
jgi:hypothetical protein